MSTVVSNDGSCIKHRVPVCNCRIFSNYDKDEQVFFIQIKNCPDLFTKVYR